MPPPPRHPDLPQAAQPRYGRNFDPWNAVALGHQRAETRGPGGWREHRTGKLYHQLGAGNSGGLSPNDDGGGGDDDVRPRAANSVVDMLRRPGTMETGGQDHSQAKQNNTVAVTSSSNSRENHHAGQEQEQEKGGTTKIFDGLVVYVNGSTHPLISDHKLKHVLVEHGARVSVHLGRRHVSHVILGRLSSTARGHAGAGGGLAGGKLDKEVRRVGGCGVKYVGVEWVLESLRAGRRLPEARFGTVKVAARGQPSVYGVFSSSSSSSSTKK